MLEIYMAGSHAWTNHGNLEQKDDEAWRVQRTWC